MTEPVPNEEEQALLNEGVIFKPEFIPYYLHIQDAFKLTDMETKLYGFIRFYTRFNPNGFYFKNEDLAEMFNVKNRTISQAVSNLVNYKLVEIDLKIKTGGGKVRNVRLAENCASDTQNFASQSSKNLLVHYINNINNNNISNIINNMSVKQLNELGLKKLTKQENKLKNEEIDEIFELYQKKIQPKSRLSNQAKIKINARLQEYNKEELKQAINNFSAEAWWMENNSHRGVKWFFANQDRIEQFINLNNKQKPDGGQARWSQFD